MTNVEDTGQRDQNLKYFTKNMMKKLNIIVFSYQFKAYDSNSTSNRNLVAIIPILIF